MRLVVHRFAVVMTAAMVMSLVAAPSISASGTVWSHRDAKVCAPADPGSAACDSVARVLFVNGLEFHAASPADLRAAARPAASVSYSAVGIRTAYGITTSGDPSRVIAIVDAYDDTNAYANLATYRSAMGLPAINNCSLSTLTGLGSGASAPCFAKVNQTGGTSLPTANAGWANEEDLDLQAASAVCQLCSIVLFEASSSSFANLGTAVTTASNTAHVLAISNSYGSNGDVSGASYPAWDNAAKKGIAVMASTGDSGYGVGFPATGTYVLGIGGTNVQVDSSGARSSESAWSGAGSGCSTYNAAPPWQVISNSPCGSKKAIADLSADADPNSGLQVYTTYNGRTGWYIFGGTSLASPLMGALYAMQGGYGGSTYASAYAWASTTAHYDVTSGSNGSCSPSVLCNAGTGWDGPTGLGSIQMAAVAPVVTTITVSPPSASVAAGGTQQFTATAYDQSNNMMNPQPTFTWSVPVAAGTINASGLFTAGSSAGGPYTVTASSGGASGTASVTVTAAPVPDFSLSASPSSLSVKRGSAVTSTISVVPANGFSGSVSLTVSGLPAGVTATLAPSAASPGAPATLTLKTASNTKTRTYNLTVTGTYGTLSHSASISLRVTK
jgi:hypothetical protein